MDVVILFLVISSDKAKPVSKPSFKLSSKVKLPLADPITVSFVATDQVRKYLCQSHTLVYFQTVKPGVL